jgi:uncharacterized protein YcfJ
VFWKTSSHVEQVVVNGLLHGWLGEAVEEPAGRQVTLVAGTVAGGYEKKLPVTSKPGGSLVFQHYFNSFMSLITILNS